MPKPFFRYLSQANQLGKGSLFGVPTEVIAIAGKELYVDPAVHEQFKKFARKWLDIYAQSLLDPEALSAEPSQRVSSQ